jgi:peptidoglycan/xylan/chitin deacetylase (PgdA/CDA1 family)
VKNGPSDWLFYVGRLMDGVYALAQWLWVRALYFSGALRWAKRDLNRHGAIVVFTFHRILDDRSFEATNSLPFIVVRERTFQKLVHYVAKHFEPVDARVAVPGLESRRLRVAVTLDDGWQDNYTHALPILRKAGIPATLFMCTGLAGESAPFWPEQIRRVLRPSLRRTYGRRSERLIEALVESLKYCSAEARDGHVRMLLSQSGGPCEAHTSEARDIDRTLDWEQVLEMDRHGIQVGSHSHAHPILTAIPLETAAQEIEESKQTLETKLGSACDLFAYPNGDWSPALREQLAEFGFRRAFTTERKAWLPETDLLSIPRAHVQQEDLVGFGGSFSPAMFEYATIWKIWLAMRRDRWSTPRIAVRRETV